MGVAQQLFGLSSLVLQATVESLLVIKLFPNGYNGQSHLFPVFVILGANITFGVVFWFFLYPNFFSPLRKIPGPRSPFSVTYRQLLVKDRPPGDLFLDLVAKYPGEEMLSLGFFENQILLTQPRLLADLLVHKSYEFVKPPRISGFLRHVLGDGLIVIEGNQHKFLRKNTMPAFGFRHIKDLYPMIWGKCLLLTDTLKKEDVINQEIPETKSKGGVIELQQWASKVTLDIIGIAGLGRNFNTLQKAEDPLNQIYEELLDPDGEKLLFSISAFVFGLETIRLIPWKMNNLFNYLTSSLNEICTPMIKEKREAIHKKGDDHFDILSLLIKSDNFSDSELKDQLLTFLAAGHETTASAITWACYLLAKSPELQVKLREEVREALPNITSLNPSDPVPEDLTATLEALPYLNGIMHETLRLYPTVPITMRQAIRDTTLGGQVIPKGTVMVLSMWGMNRSPEVWGPDAGKFMPERWIGEGGKPNQTGGASSNYEFLTFLHGPRSCIGQNFAKAEMRCLLATIVGAFEWDLAMDDAKVLPRGVITIKPAHGMYLRMKPLKV